MPYNVCFMSAVRSSFSYILYDYVTVRSVHIRHDAILVYCSELGTKYVSFLFSLMIGQPVGGSRSPRKKQEAGHCLSL